MNGILLMFCTEIPFHDKLKHITKAVFTNVKVLFSDLNFFIRDSGVVACMNKKNPTLYSLWLNCLVLASC